jgi:hypothetical protein
MQKFNTSTTFLMINIHQKTSFFLSTFWGIPFHYLCACHVLKVKNTNKLIKIAIVLYIIHISFLKNYVHCGIISTLGGQPSKDFVDMMFNIKYHIMVLVILISNNNISI